MSLDYLCSVNRVVFSFVRSLPLKGGWAAGPGERALAFLLVAVLTPGPQNETDAAGQSEGGVVGALVGCGAKQAEMVNCCLLRDRSSTLSAAVTKF